MIIEIKLLQNTERVYKTDKEKFSKSARVAKSPVKTKNLK